MMLLSILAQGTQGFDGLSCAASIVLAVLFAILFVKYIQRGEKFH